MADQFLLTGNAVKQMSSTVRDVKVIKNRLKGRQGVRGALRGAQVYAKITDTSDATNFRYDATQVQLDGTSWADVANGISFTSDDSGVGQIRPFIDSSNAQKDDVYPVWPTGDSSGNHQWWFQFGEPDTQYSIEYDSTTGKLQFVNDTSSPGNNKVYGTDSSGDRGWQDVVSEVDTTFSVTGNGVDQPIKLVNDETVDDIGNEHYYGTDTGGTLGYHALPGGNSQLSVSGSGKVGNPYQLTNDEALPVSGNAKFYGIDTGSRGFYDSLSAGDKDTSSGTDIKVYADEQGDNIRWFVKVSDLPGGGVVDTTHSITGDGINSPIKLVNDEDSPSSSQYYGTNSSGTLGYFALPSVGADEKVKVSSGDTVSDYLFEKLDVQVTTEDINLDLELGMSKTNPGGEESVNLFVNLGGLDGYNASNLQVLVQDTGSSKWMDTIDIGDAT